MDDEFTLVCQSLDRTGTPQYQKIAIQKYPIKICTTKIDLLRFKTTTAKAKILRTDIPAFYFDLVPYIDLVERLEGLIYNLEILKAGVAVDPTKCINIKLCNFYRDI